MKVKSYYAKLQPWAVEALSRDKYLCRDCGSRTSLVVHHLDESRSKGYKNMNNDLGNLMTLCRPCHAKIHGFNKASKFTDNIKDMLIEKKSYSEIARILGVSRERIRQIVNKNSNLKPYAFPNNWPGM